jgi:hypothetical protein
MPSEPSVPGLDCPLDREYSEAEWQAFLRCAREGMASGERLHRELYAKAAEHSVGPWDVEHAVRADAALVRYTNRNGRDTLGLWDPHSRLFVVGTIPDGLVLNAFRLDDEQHWERYVSRFERLRWLKR